MRMAFLYASVWFLPTTSSIWYMGGYSAPLSKTSLSLMVALIIVFIGFSLIFTISNPGRAPIQLIVSKLDSRAVQIVLRNLSYFWFLIFLLETVVSRGVPAFWSDGRGYADFGIPVVHGFSNAIRGMNFSLLVTFMYLDFRIKRKTVLLILFSLFSALVLEHSRGAFIVMLSFGFGAMLLFQPFKFLSAIKFGVYGIVLVITFSSFQFIRYAESPKEELIKNFTSLVKLGKTTNLYQPLLDYVATPAQNAGLNIDIAPLIKFDPKETISPLLPSIVRNIVFSEQKSYGLLVNEAYNTTSFITPFVRDFGIIGALFLLSIYLLFVSYIYACARRGNLKCLIALGPITMTIALSFFTNYISSLPFVFSLILSPLLANLIRKKQSNSGDKE